MVSRCLPCPKIENMEGSPWERCPFFCFRFFYAHICLLPPGLLLLFCKAGNFKPSCIWSKRAKKPVKPVNWSGQSSFWEIDERTRKRCDGMIHIGNFLFLPLNSMQAHKTMPFGTYITHYTDNGRHLQGNGEKTPFFRQHLQIGRREI